MLSAWLLGRDLSSLTRHTPVSPEAGSILTSPLLGNINGAAGTAPDSRMLMHSSLGEGEGEGRTGSADFGRGKWWRGGPSRLHW